MKTLWLRVRAPFAAFRGFQAGVYRATSPLMPPSAAYGLVLNLAGIEMRAPTSGQTTLIRDDVPKLRIALGVVSPAERGSLYQQLHSYPVGNSGKELAARTHGAKYWIVPVRRELLIGFDGMIGVQSADDYLFNRIERGLRGEFDEVRYGLPFAGDNNFLFDRIDIVEPPTTTHWYTRIQPGEPPRKGSCRLTVGIDRADNSKTSSYLFAPIEAQSTFPPESAWTWTPSPPPEA
ncbi:MAG TPA: type I-MYXAN CRISPR-associated protein Cas5/Cmx5/DevS [Abditibacteriaceae bacterium]